MYIKSNGPQGSAGHPLFLGSVRHQHTLPDKPQ